MVTPLIGLVSPEGGALRVALVRAGTRAGLPSATFDLDAEAWEQLESHGLLHADPARRRSPARPFDRARPVQVEAVLDPVAAVDGSDGLAERLVAARPGDPLLETEAWWALSATQEIELPPDLAGTGSLQEGVSFEHPSWLRDVGSVGLEEAWQRAMELGERFDESSTPLLDVIAAVFADQEWDIDRPNPEATIVHAGVASDHGDFDLYVRTDEDAHLVTVFAVLPIETPEDRVHAVHELAARLNQTVPVGSYEADPDTGLLSFKGGVDVTGDRLSVANVRQLIGTVLRAGERARPLLADVVHGRRSPAEVARPR